MLSLSHMSNMSLSLGVCVLLIVNIIWTKQVSKNVRDNLGNLQKEMLTAREKNNDCRARLEGFDEKHQKLKNLTVEVDTLKEQKNSMQEELINLQEQLDGDKAALDAENAKINEQLMNDLDKVKPVLET